jgi:large subunit ribosomal protein L35
MPKMKSHSGAKKRFKKTATGKLRARHSFTSHNLGKKSAKRKRHLGRPVVVTEADRKRVEALLHK